MSDAKLRGKKQADFAILGGPTEDGQGAHLLRFREGSVTAGEIRPVREGEPVTHSELVRLHPLDTERRVCKVEVLHEPAKLPAGAPAELPDNASRSSSHGPARVSTDRYRKNWDTIFDGKRDWSVN